MILNKKIRDCRIYIYIRVLFSVVILCSLSNKFSKSFPPKNAQTISQARINENSQANVYEFIRLTSSSKTLKESTNAGYSQSYYETFSNIILKEFKLKVNNEFNGLLNYFIAAQRTTST